MMLHKDQNSFNAAILAAADNLEILPVFIEKDYWITLVLKRLSESNLMDSVVFKGGTSLSKGYRLIDRFSEDIDIALLNVSELSGNKVKSIIRKVEKDISVDLFEINDHPKASKGSRFRKSYFRYTKTGDDRFYEAISDNLIIEINSFANPFPYEKREITSLVSSSLAKNNQMELIKKYELMPVTLNVLHKNQTLLEKLVSLFRFSFEEDPVLGISGKIRHFYDLHYLLNDKECKAYVDSAEFLKIFQEIWSHDQAAFDEPKGWQRKDIKEAPLYLRFPELWDNVKENYRKELSSLSFKPLPEDDNILKSLAYIISKL